jgi:hypothetical protein
MLGPPSGATRATRNFPVESYMLNSGPAPKAATHSANPPLRDVKHPGKFSPHLISRTTNPSRLKDSVEPAKTFPSLRPLAASARSNLRIEPTFRHSRPSEGQWTLGPNEQNGLLSSR